MGGSLPLASIAAHAAISPAPSAGTPRNAPCAAFGKEAKLSPLNCVKQTAGFAEERRRRYRPVYRLKNKPVRKLKFPNRTDIVRAVRTEETYEIEHKDKNFCCSRFILPFCSG